MQAETESSSSVVIAMQQVGLAGVPVQQGLLQVVKQLLAQALHQSLEMFCLLASLQKHFQALVLQLGNVAPGTFTPADMVSRTFLTGTLLLLGKGCMAACTTTSYPFAICDMQLILTLCMHCCAWEACWGTNHRHCCWLSKACWGVT